MDKASEFVRFTRKLATPRAPVLCLERRGTWRTALSIWLVLCAMGGSCVRVDGASAVAAGRQTSVYVFEPERSTLLQTGGFAGVNWTYRVEGQFRLMVDLDARTASFAQVEAKATDDSPYHRTHDPNEVFNLTGLAGRVVDETTVRFEGAAYDGSSVLITLTFADDTVTLKGQTTPPPHSADFFLFSLEALAQRKYSGGSGTTEDPYRIATAADLIAVSDCPDKHFILTADIDLDPNLPGGRAFTTAVIAPAMNGPAEVRGDRTGPAFIQGDDFAGVPFTGTLSGNGHKIRRLVIREGANPFVGLFGCIGFTGSVRDVYLDDIEVAGSACVGGLAGSNRGAIDSCHVSGRVSGSHCVGGLVGANLGEGFSLLRTRAEERDEASIAHCSAHCEVAAGENASCLGGLVGENGLLQCCEMPLMQGVIRACLATGNVSAGAEAMGLGGLVGWYGLGTITDCYATGNISAGRAVAGPEGRRIGGLAGYHPGGVTRCYSTGRVSVGEASPGVGGLIGESFTAPENSFWDVETSGWTTSDGGIGKSTRAMQTAYTFLEAGWDFAGETQNGTEDIWWIFEGRDYPRLSWERVLGDDFEDGQAEPLWVLYQPEPQRVWLKEVNGRLEVEAVAQDEDVDAIYVPNGWRLDATKDFALRVDFHFSRQGGGDGRVTLGVVPSLDPAGMQWAEFEVGCFGDIGPFYLYEVSDRSWVQEETVARRAEDGTLYMSYDSDADKLYVSDIGYGEANSWLTASGLLRGRWASEAVYVILSGGSEGMALTTGDAWLDNLVIDAGAVEPVAPASHPDDNLHMN